MIVNSIVDFVVKNISILGPIFIISSLVSIFIFVIYFIDKKRDRERQEEISFKESVKIQIKRMEQNEREKYERGVREEMERRYREEIDKRERERIERKAREEKEKFNAIKVADIDSMSGVDFEKYLQKLLIAMQYTVIMTKASGDFGVDLIASKGNDKIAIQVKRYKTSVSRRAISDAVTGMHHYKCNKAMVITSNYFTRDATKLASSTNCILINRDALADWIVRNQRP